MFRVVVVVVVVVGDGKIGGKRAELVRMENGAKVGGWN